MRERTAGLIASLLLALVRALLPTRERHRAAPPQLPLIEQRLAAPPRHPAHVCPCERERILQRRRALWIAYGIDAIPRPISGAEVSA
ncbi:hypothetical protein [Streptomyces sp. NPDC051738]|uniref:hypothetical protein n=1 Tax=Streptomyces sp. NPDC051738 TaxID=3365672 RepID=UPI0037CDF23D